MPVTQRRTRKQLRHSIGMLLGAIRHEGGQVDAVPTETSVSPAKIVDSAIALGVPNEHRGRWVYATDSTGTDHLKRVVESSLEERSLTVSVAFPSLPGSSWTYELWDADVQPLNVHEFINQAIGAVTRKGAIGTVDESFHTGGSVLSFYLDDEWTGVRELSWRSGFSGVSVARMDAPLTALSSNGSVSRDGKDLREGTASARLEITDGAIAGEEMAEDSFPASNLRAFDRVEFWHKSSGDLTSSNLVMQFMQGSSVVSAVSVPESSTGEWKYRSVNLDSPQQNEGVNGLRVSVGSSDGGAFTTWFDDLAFTRANTETWHRVPREFWSVDRGEQKFTISPDANLPYARLRVTGVRAPRLLQSDSQVCEIDSQYVIHAAAAGLLRSRGDRRGSARDASLQQADQYEQLAQGLRLRMNTPANIRWVDD